MWRRRTGVGGWSGSVREDGVQDPQRRAADREAKADIVRDQAETLRVLAEGVASVRELETRIEALFTDDGLGAQNVITCSSVHKAKGLEADRVFVLRDTLSGFGKKLPTPAQLREEANIEYVAITRAKSVLAWVDGLTF